MGRVKSDGKGGYYYDENDSGPDQSGGTWAPGGASASSSGSGGSSNVAPTSYPGGSSTFDERTGQYGIPPNLKDIPSPPSPFTGSGTTRAYAPIQGFDTTKLQNTGYSSGKYTPALRTFSAYLGSGGQVSRGNLQGAVSYAQANGHPGAHAVGDDKIDFGDGNGPIDVVQSNGSVWFNNQPGAGGGSGGVVSAGVAGTGGGAGGAGMAGAGSAGGGQFSAISGQSSDLYNLLMKRATQSLDVNPSDPIIKGQTDAFNAQQQRDSKNYLSTVAEKQGANANISAETRIAGEQVGQNTSAFEAQLMGQELATRRQEIQQALSGAAGFLTSQQQMALQEELAQLNITQRQWETKMGLGQQESEFARRLAQQGYEFDATDAYRNSPLVGA